MGSTRDLYCRSDARYGPDDPILWPQPFNRRYPYFAAVSKRPSSSSGKRNIMWIDLEEDDLLYSDLGIQHKEGIVKPRIIDDLHGCTSDLQATVQEVYPSLPDDNKLLIKENGKVVDRGLVELQRACLTIQAVLDFHRQIRRAASPDFISKPFLYSNGFPVYYVREYRSFDRQTILKVVPFQRAVPPAVQTSPADPPYNPITTTQAGSDDKFAAIRVAAMQCFSSSDPFSNLHLPANYASSYHLGSGRIIAPGSSSSSMSGILPGFPISLPKAPPKPQRNLFADLPPDDPLVPPAIPAWANVNLTIKRDNLSSKKRLLLVPDPTLFFGHEDKARQMPMLKMWDHLHYAWYERLQDQRVLMPQTVDMWQKACSYTLIKPFEDRMVISSKQQTVVEGHILVEETCRLTNRPANPPDSNLEPHTIREIIRELCLVNFRYELQLVDAILDQSKPQLHPSISRADFEVASAAHSSGRKMLITDVLGYDRLTPPPNQNLGLTSLEWPERYSAMKSLWRLMDSWPGEKPVVWHRGIDNDVGVFTSAVRGGWERSLAEFYVQCSYNALGFVPSLPRCL
ncbi:hypothetical protein GYMLUDRAFT_248923 [Collybiopsis luxurians FD-317 M1]|uniref:Uncharacterized protein n=1 Tax=Collybiopsis luxurians FD-317 M1 TaxID=944289 RepID=A0A0D0CJE9_9AGAR|nr:hypothetical protein GYMLUDRAFT_248923 [Collybiopsis luxurians FD-317 M1]